jgi:hypothetical protein
MPSGLTPEQRAREVVVKTADTLGLFGDVRRDFTALDPRDALAVIVAANRNHDWNTTPPAQAGGYTTPITSYGPALTEHPANPMLSVAMALEGLKHDKSNLQFTEQTRIDAAVSKHDGITNSLQKADWKDLLEPYEKVMEGQVSAIQQRRMDRALQQTRDPSYVGSDQAARGGTPTPRTTPIAKSATPELPPH